jgi:hypothetical protein
MKPEKSNGRFYKLPETEKIERLDASGPVRNDYSEGRQDTRRATSRRAEGVK